LANGGIHNDGGTAGTTPSPLSLTVAQLELIGVTTLVASNFIL
jgi:hypothetical protein